MTVLARRLAVTLVASFALAASLRGQSPREEELARSQYQSGLDFLQSRRYAEALKDFQAVVDSFPKSSVADAALVQIAMYQLDVARNPAAAQAANDKLLKEYPSAAAPPTSKPRSPVTSACRGCSRDRKP
jgi:TolA-binding protein